MTTNSNVGRPQSTTKVELSQNLQHTVAVIHKEMQDLELRRAAIVKRIAVIRQTVQGLVEVFGPNALQSELQSMLSRRCSVTPRRYAQLTGLCRTLLRGSPSDALTLHEVLAHIQEKHPAILNHYKSLPNSLRVVLSRLVMYGEAIETMNDESLRAWRVAPPSPLDRDVHDHNHSQGS
jgi:hypothetical protein